LANSILSNSPGNRRLNFQLRLGHRRRPSRSVHALEEDRMSLPDSIIRCTGCDFLQIVATQPMTVQYRLDDGTLIPGRRQLGWCDDCEGIRTIEALEDRSQLTANIARQERRLSSAGSRTVGAIGRLFRKPAACNEDAQVSSLKLRLRLLDSRTSPERCLACGGTRTKPLRFSSTRSSDGFQHSCGGVLRLLEQDEDAPLIARIPQHITLDSEGRRIL
jgi:hypothetical protein